MKIFKILSLALLLFLPGSVRAQEGVEAFAPIVKYLEKGDAEKLSAWFDNSLEISVCGVTSDSSRKQATQIMKNFFTNVKPTSFVLQHAASKSNMKYALGVLSAGTTSYAVTIFVNFQDNSYKIQQLKIEKLR